MKIAHIIQILPLLLLLASSGCVTRSLWDTRNRHGNFRPAEPSKLQLFDSRARRDVFVVYEEYFRGKGAVRTRAYWLYQNESRIARERRPDFASPKLSEGLTPIPVFTGTNLPVAPDPETLYAVAADSGSFALYAGSREVSSHLLPVYDESETTATRVLLTPVTLVLDVGMTPFFLKLKDWEDDEE